MTNFNDLCKVIEKCGPSAYFYNIIKNTPLFEFPGKAHEILPKMYNLDEISFFKENFFLPFPEVLVADSASIIYLKDIDINQKGIMRNRLFTEFVDLSTPLAEFGRHAELRTNTNMNGWIILTGFIALTPSNDPLRYAVDGYIDHILHISEKGKLITLKENIDYPHCLPYIENPKTAIEEIYYFNNPSNFIVERIGQTRNLKLSKKLKKKGSDRIPRDDERSVYTIITLERAKKIFNYGAGQEVTPHPRRRHFRTLNSDRFVNKKGQIIIVKECWIGPTECNYEGKKYKVRLDI